jgi:hypothetical protein
MKNIKRLIEHHGQFLKSDWVETNKPLKFAEKRNLKINGNIKKKKRMA